MKRLGLNRNFLPATLFLACVSGGGVYAQDLLSALPPKPTVHAPEPAPPTESAAIAQPEQPVPSTLPKTPPRPVNPQAVRARMLEMFDQNKDGRLDENERAAAKKYAEEHGLGPGGPMAGKRPGAGNPADRMRSELLHRFDRNGNGKIDDDEMTALEQAMRTRLGSAPVLRQRFDKNGDGKIDEAEWTAARPQLQQWLNEAPPAAKSEPKPAAK